MNNNILTTEDLKEITRAKTVKGIESRLISMGVKYKKIGNVSIITTIQAINASMDLVENTDKPRIEL